MVLPTNASATFASAARGRQGASTQPGALGFAEERAHSPCQAAASSRSSRLLTFFQLPDQ